MRRLLVRALGVLLLALPLAVMREPAAAGPTPWAFGPIVHSEVIVGAGATGSVITKCASGYVALGGGFDTFAPVGTIERVAEYRTTLDGRSAWLVTIHNFHSSAVYISAYPVCANAAQVGPIETASANLGRNGTTWIAGGQATCPAGKVAIGGGADWNSVDPDRRIDTTAPSTNGTGWVVSGWNDSASTLHVEAYCVPAADVGVSAPLVEFEDFGGTTTFAHQTVCGPGKRSATGGVITGGAGSGGPDPSVYRAVQEQSHHVLPVDNGTAVRWFDHGRVDAGTRIFYSVWCVPASQPVVTITSGPPAYTNSTSATFSFQATDPAGEPLSVGCTLDGAFKSCPNSPSGVSQLTEGTHTYVVRAQNESRFSASDSHTWTVDLTPPTATPAAGRVPLLGPLALTFSEPVQGVAVGSVQVRVAGTSTVVPGQTTVNGAGTAASWRPAAALVPGETYAVTVSSAVVDRAGNALASGTHLVRATGTVESGSSSLRETWDVDRAAAADGGRFAASRDAGASATWRFAASAGQRAVVYGVRQPVGGYADVYVDGVKRARVSTYRSSTRHRVALFTSAALGAGTHSVEVRVVGSKPSASRGTWVGVDSLVVGGTTRQESLAAFRFRRVATGAASGGSYDTVTHATSGDTGAVPSYSLTFKGTSVAVRATRSPASGSARVYVDGVLLRNLNLRAASTSYQALVVSITGLTDARHVLRIVPVGTSGGARSAVGIDRVDVG